MLKQLQTDTSLIQHRFDLAVETIDGLNSELREEHGRHLETMAQYTALADAARAYLADANRDSRSRLEFLLLAAPK